MRKMTTLVKPVMYPANLNVFISLSLSLGFDCKSKIIIKQQISEIPSN